jgi:hypothetical protein
MGGKLLAKLIERTVSFLGIYTGNGFNKNIHKEESSVLGRECGRRDFIKLCAGALAIDLPCLRGTVGLSQTFYNSCQGLAVCLAG